MIAEANVTEAAFASAESTLSAEIVNAELAIESAENVLAAEQAWFVAEAGCGAETEQTEAEQTEAEQTEAKGGKKR